MSSFSTPLRATVDSVEATVGTLTPSTEAQTTKKHRVDSVQRVAGPEAVQNAAEPIDVDGLDSKLENDLAFSGYHFFNGHYYCKHCFNEKGEPQRSVGRTGRGGSAMEGRYGPRGTVDGRRKHAATHKAQPSLDVAVTRLFNGPVKHEAWAWAIVDGNHAFSAFQRDSFLEALASTAPGMKIKVPSAVELRGAVTALAADLRRTLREKYSGTPALLAIDGGTLHRKPLLNFMIQAVREGSAPFFVCSRQIPDGTAETIAQNINEVRKFVRETFGMFPIAIVSDNASAMARGCADADDPEDEEATVMFEDDGGHADEELVEPSQPFFVHIRCWCHALQLCIGDIAKQCPVAVNVLSRVLHIPRATRVKISALRAQADCSKKQLIIPSVTRWNSSTRAAERILDMFPQLQEAGVGISSDEIIALKMFVVVTAPFCWATTVLQGDSGTLALTQEIVCKIRQKFEEIKTQAQQFPETTRDQVLRLVECAVDSLSRRSVKYMQNEITEALSAIESPQTLSQERWEGVAGLITRYFATLDLSVAGDVQSEIESFTFRPDPERMRSNTESYWQEAKQRFPKIARFRKDMHNTLVTEASVERSFQRQGDIWTPRRNRLAQDSIDDQLFIAFNYAQLRTKVTKPNPRKHKDDVPEEVWTRLLASLTDANPRTPRARRIRCDPKTIKLGTRLEVKFKIAGGQEKWYTGTVITITNPQRLEFEVAWDEHAGKDRITPFRPQTHDHDWRFCAS